MVLKGVTIGARTVRVAGSVVKTNIPLEGLAGDVPRRIIRDIAPSSDMAG